jgi:amino acid transporter
MDKFTDAINAFLLIFTFSAANSDLYIATRTLYSLAVEGNAPKIFARTNDRGVPIYALGLSSAMCGIAFVSIKGGIFETFNKFVTLVTIFGILTWISILISHIHFVRARKEQNVPDTALAYVSPFGALGSMIALVFACVITFFNGFGTFITDPTTGDTFKKSGYQDFIVSYIGVFIFAAMYFGYKIIMKSEIIAPGDADLFGGKARIDEEEAEFLAEESRRRDMGGEKMLSKIWRVSLGAFF